MNFQEKLEAFESKIGGETTAPEPPVQEPVSGEPEAQPPVDPQSDTPEPTPETPVTPEPTVEEPTNTIQEPDWNKFVEESSNGLFKSVDEFKNSLNKYQEYDALAQQKAELEAKLQADPFANPLVKQYNELVKEGKSDDQIDSWFKLQKLGDLSQLDPFDIKVERLVQEGYKRDVAERKITREFGLNIETEGDHLTEEEIRENKTRLADAKEDLRISSKADLEALQSLKVQLGQTKSPEQIQLEQQQAVLQQQAVEAEFKNQLKPIVTNIANEYNGLGTVNLNGKEGAEAVLFNVNVDPDFKAAAAERLQEYFVDGMTPVNAETVEDAKKYLNAHYLVENFQTKIAPALYNEGYSRAMEEAVKKYENHSGLPTSGLPPIQEDAGQALREQMRKAAQGLDD